MSKWINVLTTAALGVTCAAAQSADEGRFKATVSVGAVLSKDAGDFSKLDPYLALDTESILRGPKSMSDDVEFSHYFSSLLNVRLSSIPVDGVPNADAKIASDAGFDSFLKSHKAATVQIGAFYGFVPPQFKWTRDADNRFAFAAGPVFRFGYQSITETIKLRRYWNPEDDLFESFSGGGRVAWLQRAKKQDPAKKDDQGKDSDGFVTLAYFDLCLGRFQNFEKVSAATPAGASYQSQLASGVGTPLGDDKKTPLRVGKADFKTSREPRVYMEGRIRFPAAKWIYFGLELNNGSGKDDLRFFGGLDFDLSKAFTHLLGSKTPGE